MTMKNTAITPEQFAERDAWEQRFARGECTLADLLMMTLHAGAPASPRLIALLEGAFATYSQGLVDDLAEPFGIAIGKREKNRHEHQTHRSNVKFHVDAFHAQGFPLLDPNDFSDRETAFTKTAALLTSPGKALSAANAFDIYRGKDLKKRKPAR